MKALGILVKGLVVVFLAPALFMPFTTAAVAAPDQPVRPPTAACAPGQAVTGDPPGSQSNGICSVQITEGSPNGLYGWKTSNKVVCHETVRMIIITGLIRSEHSFGPDGKADNMITVLNPKPGETYSLMVSAGMWMCHGNPHAKVEVAIFQVRCAVTYVTDAKVYKC